MFALSRKTDYALIAMSELARRGDRWATAREIAVSARVPLPVLSNVLHLLRQSGLVAASRGARGGYRLAREPHEIALSELVEAVDGPFRLTVCCNDGDEHPEARCDLEPTCQIRGPVLQVHERLRHFLGNVTLDQIAFRRVFVSLGVGGRSGVDTEQVYAGTAMADAGVAAG